MHARARRRTDGHELAGGQLVQQPSRWAATTTTPLLLRRGVHLHFVVASADLHEAQGQARLLVRQSLQL